MGGGVREKVCKRVRTRRRVGGWRVGAVKAARGPDEWDASARRDVSGTAVPCVRCCWRVRTMAGTSPGLRYVNRSWFPSAVVGIEPSLDAGGGGTAAICCLIVRHSWAAKSPGRRKRTRSLWVKRCACSRKARALAAGKVRRAPAAAAWTRTVGLGMAACRRRRVSSPSCWECGAVRELRGGCNE